MIARVRPIPTPTGPLPRLIDELIDDPWAVVREWLGWVPSAVRAVLLVASILVALVVALAIWRAWSSWRLRSSARRIRILPPPGVAGAPGAEMLWMGLHALLRPWWRRLLSGQPHLAWEMVARPEHVEVSIWVPRVVPPGLVERAIEASWPGAKASAVPGDPLASSGSPRNGLASRLVATEFALAEGDRFPIGDPGEGALGLALAGLTGLAGGEQAAVQVVARPATSASRKRLLRAAAALRVGGGRARRATGGMAQMRFLNPVLEEDVRAVVRKASSPLWSCAVRVAVSSPSRKLARGRIHALAGGFAIFEGRNGFRRWRSPGAGHRLRKRALRRSFLLSVPELAQMATLPAAGAVEGLERAGAGVVAPSRDLPDAGKVLGKAEGPAGRSVAISVEDARHHLHVLGETGTGKSTLLAQLVLQDAEAGRSAVVIDPKGDLVEAILERLPATALGRTCLLDPDDRKSAVGLDLLGGDDPDLVVEDVLGVFRRIYQPWWGPRTDDIMRAACLTLTRIPNTTLVEVPLLLTDAAWRASIREHLADAVGVASFWRWFDRLPEGQRAQHIAPLLNKLRAFVLRGPVRAIVGQDRPKLDVEELLDSGGLLLVRIPKGTLGEETSRLLGALVVARVWQACMKRAERAEKDRRDAALYVDEMHNYLALPKSFEDLLAEARGYRLSLVLAHQHMGQLPREMRDGLAANARTKISFTCSPDDAFVLEHHFSPQLTAHDLSHLRAFQAACRPCVDGGHGAAFTFATEALGKPEDRRAEAVREASNARFGQARKLVEIRVRRRHEAIEDGKHPLPEKSTATEVADSEEGLG